MRRPGPTFPIALVCMLVGCGSSGSSTNDSGTNDAGGGSAYDSCVLLSPSDIANVVGGTVGNGTRMTSYGMLDAECDYPISGTTNFGAARSQDQFSVTYNPSLFFPRDAVGNSGIPQMDIPELGPDAYLRLDGELWNKVGNGGLVLKVYLDPLTVLGNDALFADLKQILVPLGQLAKSRI